MLLQSIARSLIHCFCGHAFLRLEPKQWVFFNRFITYKKKKQNITFLFYLYSKFFGTENIQTFFEFSMLCYCIFCHFGRFKNI